MNPVVREWLRNIIVLVMLATYAEMFLPRNRFRPYTRLVVSLIVMLVVLQPIVELIRGSHNMLHDLSLYENWLKQEEYRATTKVKAINNDKLAVEVYKKKLSEQISKDVLDTTGRQVAEISVAVVEQVDSKDFGIPKYIDITFVSGGGDKLGSSVTPVVILIGETPDEGSKSGGTTTEEILLESQIRTLLLNRYGIGPDNIQIQFTR